MYITFSHFPSFVINRRFSSDGLQPNLKILHFIICGITIIFTQFKLIQHKVAWSKVDFKCLFYSIGRFCEIHFLLTLLYDQSWQRKSHLKVSLKNILSWQPKESLRLLSIHLWIIKTCCIYIWCNILGNNLNN